MYREAERCAEKLGGWDPQPDQHSESAPDQGGGTIFVLDDSTLEMWQIFRNVTQILEFFITWVIFVWPGGVRFPEPDAGAAA